MATEMISLVPRAIWTTMATAHIRTPSAAARVARKIPAVILCSVFPKPAVYKLISGVHLAAEILRYKEQADDNATSQIAEYKLEEAEISGIGYARCANDGECAGFRGNDRKTDGPPWNRAVSKEIIAQGTLRLSEPQSKERNAE